MSALPQSVTPSAPGPRTRPRPSGTTKAIPPRLRVVPRRARPARRLATVLALLAASGVFGVVGLSALAAEQAFAARDLSGEISQLEFRYDELTAEVAGLEAPQRVRATAIEQLGMVPASQPAYLVLDTPFLLTSSTDEEPLLATVTDPVKQARGSE